MSTKFHRARAPILVATGVCVVAQFDGKQGPVLKKAMQDAHIDITPFVEDLRTATNHYAGMLKDRAPKIGEHGETRADVAARRDATHVWLDEMEEGLRMAMAAGVEGSEHYPTRFKLADEDGLGAVAVGLFAAQIVEDLATLVPKLSKYGITDAFIAEGRALTDGVRPGIEDERGAMNQQKAATGDVKAAKDAVADLLQQIVYAHRKANRRARGTLVPLDLSPMSGGGGGGGAGAAA